MACNYNNIVELTYSYGGHLTTISELRYYTDIIQISRCCLLKPNYYIPAKEFAEITNIGDYLRSLQDLSVPLSPTAPDHPMCNKSVCKLLPYRAIDNVIVGLSYACNLNCVNCWYSGIHFDDSNQKELYFHVLYGLKKSELGTITLTNKGEPFFYLKETMDYLKTLTIEDTKCVYSLTNGNLLDEKSIKLMKSIKENSGVDFKFLFSIDAVSSEVYKKVRIGGNFSKVLDNLESCIRQFGTRNLTVSFTGKEYNLHEINQAVPFYKENFGVDVQISFDSFHPEMQDKAKREYGFNS